MNLQERAIKTELIDKPRIVSKKPFTADSLKLTIQKVTGTITQISLVALCGVGLFLGVSNNSLPLALGLGGLIIVIHFFLKFYVEKQPWFKFFTALCLSSIAIQIFHQAPEASFVFALFFVVIALLILYYTPLLIWVTTFFFLSHSLLFFFLGSVKIDAKDLPQILIYHGVLLGFVFICDILSRNLRKALDSEERVSGVLNDTLRHSQNNIEYAKEIASGIYNTSYTPAKDDLLGQSLLEMSETLKAAAEGQQIRNWQIEGIANAGDILRLHNDNIGELTFKILQYLVRYLNASQGGIFLLNDDDAENTFLELVACYAFSKQKFIEKRVGLGEGLVGQVFMEKQSIYMTDVPKEYLKITSGLGGAKPVSVVLFPLMIDEKVSGVIEIASLQNIKESEREFLKKVSESIASTIITSKINNRTAKLLRESQEMSEQLKLKEEEMRQSVEELQATQDDLHRRSIERERAEEEVKRQKMFMEAILNGLPMPVYVKNRSHNFLIANDAYSRYLSFSKDDILTLSHEQLFGRGADEEWKSDEEVFVSEKITSTEISTKGSVGNGKSYILTKTIFSNNTGEQFLISILLDITDRKNFEDALSLERLMFESLMNNFPDRIFFKDLESKYLRVNNAKAKRHGFDDAKLIIGHSDADFFKPEHAQKARREEQEIMRSLKGVLNIEEKLIYPDGTLAWGSTSRMPLINSEGAVLGTYGITRDITERKKVEGKLIMYEAMLKKIGERVPVVFYKFDKDNVITEFTGSGIGALNLASSSIVGMPIDKIFPLIRRYYNTNADKEITFTHDLSEGKIEHFLIKDSVYERGMIGFGVIK